MLFPGAPNKAKAANETEKAREVDALHAQSTAASQPRKAEEDGDEEVEDEVEPGPSTLAITATWLLVTRRGGVLSIRSMAVCSGTCGGGCG